MDLVLSKLMLVSSVTNVTNVFTLYPVLCFRKLSANEIILLKSVEYNSI